MVRRPLTPFFFICARSRKSPFIPVLGLDRVEDYAESVKAATKNDGRGCCLRLVESDLESVVECAHKSSPF